MKIKNGFYVFFIWFFRAYVKKVFYFSYKHYFYGYFIFYSKIIKIVSILNIFRSFHLFCSKFSRPCSDYPFFKLFPTFLYFIINLPLIIYQSKTTIISVKYTIIQMTKNKERVSFLTHICLFYVAESVIPIYIHLNIYLTI